MSLQKAVFVLLLIFILSPYGSPPLALALGLFLALTIGNPFSRRGGRATRIILQASVVLLGFGMNLSEIYKAGTEGVAFTIATIFGTLAAGYLVGRFLSVGAKTSSLISSGTAICGGSAIAAVAPAIKASNSEISVSLGAVFILNSAALFLFPLIGRALEMTQNQFGLWSAIAIHDTSSVVGAAASYGPEALAVATTVKLARALWIAPLALGFAFIYRDRGDELQVKTAVPWFIFLFLAAAAIRSYAPSFVFPSIFDSLVNLARAGMTVTLFLIGASLSRATIRSVGARPFVQAVILWLLISIVGLVAVMRLAR